MIQRWINASNARLSTASVDSSSFEVSDHGCRHRDIGKVTGHLMSRARAGDSDAVPRAGRAAPRELLVRCYRMLGSFQDAEDVFTCTLSDGSPVLVVSLTETGLGRCPECVMSRATAPVTACWRARRSRRYWLRWPG
jgi:hypothetical protein